MYLQKTDLIIFFSVIKAFKKNVAGKSPEQILWVRNEKSVAGFRALGVKAARMPR